MRHSLSIAGLVLAAVCGAMLATAATTPAKAGGWHQWEGYAAPRHHRRRAYRIVPPAYNGGLRLYSSPRAYRSACAYGDCACLRSIALRTGNPVWWDKYQACSGN